jgi:uroporphyrinogen III methyltransferase / synthase
VGKPLKGRTIIVTRPRGRADELAETLRRRGARVVFAPLIRTVPPRSWAPLDAALRRLEHYDAAAFASATAVEAFFARAEALGLTPRPPAVVAAVGPATAAALAVRGWRAGTVPDDPRAEGLATALRLPPGARVLLPRAERGREVLPRRLRRAGMKVAAVTAYRTVADEAGRRALREALGAGAHAVCFASGSAVTSAESALGPARARRLLEGRAVAIGPTTAAALAARGVRAAAVARAPSARGLADAVARAVRKTP